MAERGIHELPDVTRPSSLVGSEVKILGVGFTFVVRSRDLEAFRTCRRAWDLGALIRERYVPRVPPPFDFDKAVHDALAVYYFPAMDDWKRSIVRPLAFKGFDRSMAESRAAHERVAPFTTEEARLYDEHVGLGRALLANYFVWAAEMDDFESLFADHELWTSIADPDSPHLDLGMPDRRPIRYLGRVDQLISDPGDEMWVVDHRLVHDGWTDTDTLLADDMALRHCWGMQVAYPQMIIAGTITNELRTDGQTEVVPPAEIVERDVREMTGSRHPARKSLLSPEERAAWPLDAGLRPDHVVQRQDNGLFRRTVIRRGQATMAKAGLRVGVEVSEMRDPDIPVPPILSPHYCATCQFKAPCGAMQSGGDWLSILEADFRQLDEDMEEESLRRSSVRSGIRASLGGAGYRKR